MPFFGAGVNLCDRPPNLDWRQDQNKYLPSGAELSTFLAENFSYPAKDTRELPRVSEFVDLFSGSGPLYDELHRVFDRDYPQTSVHRFFANISVVIRQKGYEPRHQLIITTNYDDLMERAFADAGQQIDLVSYLASGANAGKFVHLKPNGDEVIVQKPNEYRGIILDEYENLERPIVLKLHGAVRRKKVHAEEDSYVITEDHYIDYLTNTDISNLLPVTIVRKLRRSHFLFLGYGLRDWNLRVILRRLWGDQKLSYHSWAIQRDPEELDRKFWAKKEVEILEVDLLNYVQLLEMQLQDLPIKEEVL